MTCEQIATAARLLAPGAEVVAENVSGSPAHPVARLSWSFPDGQRATTFFEPESFAEQSLFRDLLRLSVQMDGIVDAWVAGVLQ